MSLADRVEKLLKDRTNCLNHLDRYFFGNYTGGAWDKAAAALTPHEIGPADIAVSSLLGMGMSQSLQANGKATPEGGRQLASIATDALLSVPLDRDLLDLSEEEFDRLLGDGGPLDALFHDLREALAPPQRRTVLAFKLLAGKRPRLLPVFDSQVAELLRDRGDRRWWRPVWEAVRRDGVHDQLLDLHRSAGLPDEVSALRVLDAVAWMRAKNGPAL